jgi:hypothetical protein
VPIFELVDLPIPGEIIEGSSIFPDDIPGSTRHETLR